LNLDFFESELFILPNTKQALERAKGLNERSILVVMVGIEEQLPDLLNFLRKITTAAKINLDKDTAYLTLTPKHKIGWTGISQNINPKQALIFGKTPAELGLHLQVTPYQPFEFQGVQFIFADALSEIEQDQEKKKALWSVLQSVFLS